MFDRRQFLFSTSALSAAVVSGSSNWLAMAGESQRQLSIEIIDIKVISWKPPLYHGWPTLAQRKSGELLLAFSGGRESHVCPFGRLEWMRSKDNGGTWSWPQVLYDGPIDDRDAGIVETAKGSILVTTFTSLAYEPRLARAEKALPGEPGAFSDPKLLLEWQAVHHRLNVEQRKAELGNYMFRSTDGGITWSHRYRVLVNSPHGPVVTANGRLLYAGKAIYGDEKIGVCESNDDGMNWEWIATFPTRSGDDSARYHELHLVDAADGSLICHIRNENKQDDGHTLQCESNDGGRTWTTPHTIGIWGFPSHLLRMRNGQLLMSYGHRRSPLGIQARVSQDSGKSWSDAISITADAKSVDFGYPSTVECFDGTMVTVWYEVLEGSPLAQLRQARWKWPG